ncbi:[acyl-carrier-protein] S-malonyltransferase [Tindallia magadiensis]|uniref:Malonyl CoA-acyl carrier protein transacylase n=1 Tax=Tindallia magadiensis TaxID=69895 RepID=A0A1I3DQW2_9FIRM|nr:ACP S-malonyltransferase [Tindallia magadiensis]SFH89134.1 [acyl-carrier-protein] S-malonyltransferase [Tindallia magadiensis]
MSKPLAFIFPGQGAQYIGMGKDFITQYPTARETFEEADELLQMPLTRYCLEGPDSKLNQTEITQPAVLTTSIAMLRLLKKEGFTSDLTAGLSLGEYSALINAESMEFKDAIQLVRLRGKYMQEAVPQGKGGMAAILGLKREHLQECIQAGLAHGFVSVANFNCPGQIVISGEVKAVMATMESCKEKGAKKVVMMPVSAPFHTSMLAPAGEKLSEELGKLSLQSPNQVFISNVSATPVTDAADISPALVRQVSHSVLWEDSLLFMMNQGCQTFLEIGPSNSLSGFVKRTAKEYKRPYQSYHIETVDQYLTIIETLEKEGFHASRKEGCISNRSIQRDRAFHCS